MKIDDFRRSFRTGIETLVQTSPDSRIDYDDVMRVFDEVAASPAQQAAELILQLTARNDLSYVLFGRFNIQKFPGMSGLDGHSVALIKGGDEAPVSTPKDALDLARKARRVGEIIGGENLWSRCKSELSTDIGSHQAFIHRYRTSDAYDAIALTVNDRTKDSRENSHTDFHILGPQEPIDNLWNVSQEYTPCLPELFRSVFTPPGIIDFDAIEIVGQRSEI